VISLFRDGVERRWRSLRARAFGHLDSRLVPLHLLLTRIMLPRLHLECLADMTSTVTIGCLWYYQNGHSRLRSIGGWCFAGG